MSDAGELNFIMKMRDEATATLKQHGAAIEQLGSMHQKAAAGAKEHGASLDGLVKSAREATEAIAAVWAASELNERTLGAWAQMEVSLTRIQQAAGLAQDAMDDLKDAIESTASHSLNQTDQQIAGVVKSAAQLGVEGVESLKAFATTVSQLSTVTGASVESITQGMGQILAASGQVQDGAKQFGDAFAYLADKTRGGGEGLLRTSERLSMMTAGMKMSIPEVLGMASALSNLGVRSERAAMTIGQTMTRIADLAAEGGQQLRVLAVTTGMTADQFRKLSEEHPAEALNSFLQAVHNVQASGGNVGDFLKQFGLQGRQIETTLIAASKAVDQFRAKEAQAGSASNSGLLGAEAAKYTQTLTEALHGASEALEHLGEAFGKAASPFFVAMLQHATEALTELQHAFESLPEAAQSTIAVLAIAAPMVVAAKVAFGLLAEVITVAKAALLGFAAETTVAEAGVAAVSAELGVAGAAAVSFGARMAGGIGVAIAAVELLRSTIQAATGHDPGTAAGVAQIDNDHPWLGALDNAFSFTGMSPSYAQQRGYSNDNGRDSELARQSGRRGYASHAASAGTSNPAQQTIDVGSASTALAGLDSQQKKMEELQKAQENLNALKKATPEELQTLQISQEQLVVYQQIITNAQNALDPLYKLKETWADQLRSAQAVTKEQENQAAIEKAVQEAKKDPHFAANPQNEATMRSQMGAIQQAEINKAFQEQMRGLNDQLALIGVVNGQERSRLQIEQQIADAQRKQGYSAEQLASLRMALTLTEQMKAAQEQMDRLNPQAKALTDYANEMQTLNSRLQQGLITQQEFNREKSKLDQDTLSARDPIGALVQSQQQELSQMQVIGQYRSADLKTLEQVNALKKEGVLSDQATADAVQSQLQAYNRQMQDITDLKKQMDDASNAISGSISDAIVGGLEGKRGAFRSAMESLGKDLISMAVKPMINKLMSSLTDQLEGPILAPMFANAQGLLGGLAKTGIGQAASTAASAASMNTAMMNVTAATVNIIGGGAVPGIGGQAGANDNVPIPGSSLTGAGSVGGFGGGAGGYNPLSSIAAAGGGAVSGTGNGGIGSDAVASALNAVSGGGSPFGAMPNMSDFGGTLSMFGGMPTMAAFGGTLAAVAGKGGGGSLPSWLPQGISLIPQGLGTLSGGLPAMPSWGGAGGGIPASATASLTTAGGALPAYGKSTEGLYADAAHQYFISQGYTPQEAAVMMGNLKQESNFNPRAFNPNDAGPGLNSGGIYQANKARVGDLNNSIFADTGRRVDLAHQQYGGLSDDQLFRAELSGMNKDVRGQFASSPAGSLDLLHRDARSLSAGDWGHRYEGYGDTSGPTRDMNALGFSRQYGGQSPVAAGQGALSQLEGQNTTSQLTQQFTTLQKSMVSTVPQINTALPQLSQTLTQGSQGVQSGISSLVSALSSAGGGGGGGLGSLFSGLLGAVAHSGWEVGDGAPSDGFRAISASAFSGARRYHTGLGNDEFPAILQRGERVLTANDNARTVGALSKLSAQGGTNGGGGGHTYVVNNNIYPKDADSFKKSSGQLLSDASVRIQRMGMRNG